MSRRGDCWDNAVIESFFATLRKEEADRFPSYSDAKMALFDYIEVFDNQRRRHSTLEQIGSAAFERQAAAEGMDGAIPVDAKNAPTGIWKTAQTAVSHSAHTHHPSMKKNEDRRNRR